MGVTDEQLFDLFGLAADSNTALFNLDLEQLCFQMKRKLLAICRPRLTVTIMVCALICTARLTPQTRSETTAEVRLHVVDAHGKEIRFEVRSFLNVKDDNLAHLFVGLVAPRVPYGTYRYELKSIPDGLHRMKGQLSVSAPEVFLPLVARKPVFMMGGNIASVATETPKGYIRTIRFIGLKQGTFENAWIRLDAALGGSTHNLRITGSGEARLYQPLHGEFIATVIIGGRVAALRIVDFGEIRSLAPIVISLEISDTATK